MAHILPRITSYMLRSQPDQTTDILNRLIAKVTELEKQVEEMRKTAK